MRGWGPACARCLGWGPSTFPLSCVLWALSCPLWASVAPSARQGTTPFTCSRAPPRAAGGLKGLMFSWPHRQRLGQRNMGSSPALACPKPWTGHHPHEPTLAREMGVRMHLEARRRGAVPCPRSLTLGVGGRGRCFHKGRRNSRWVWSGGLCPGGCFDLLPWPPVPSARCCVHPGHLAGSASAPAEGGSDPCLPLPAAWGRPCQSPGQLPPPARQRQASDPGRCPLAAAGPAGGRQDLQAARDRRGCRPDPRPGRSRKRCPLGSPARKSHWQGATTTLPP